MAKATNSAIALLSKPAGVTAGRRWGNLAVISLKVVSIRLRARRIVLASSGSCWRLRLLLRSGR